MENPGLIAGLVIVYLPELWGCIGHSVGDVVRLLKYDIPVLAQKLLADLCKDLHVRVRLHLRVNLPEG
ncbi:MAG: hypothetical protein LUB61_01275, partial [Eggerthellaceae bacterium]|nr:hypothetical protein [Eggerthellaceae bacterium]